MVLQWCGATKVNDTCVVLILKLERGLVLAMQWQFNEDTVCTLVIAK